LGQKRTSHYSFDYVIGAREQVRRHGEAERLRGLEVDDELELGGLQDRKVSGFCATENQTATPPP
jgi:hypothetical protein